MNWLWQPARLGWWIAWSFAIGSSYFMAGAIMADLATPPTAFQLSALYDYVLLALIGLGIVNTSFLLTYHHRIMVFHQYT